jgi:coenzyme A diphosphatase NUDT7
MLIRTATIGYAREPDYEVQPPDAPSMEERIAYVMLHNPNFRDAFIAEGLGSHEHTLTAFLREKERERQNRSKLGRWRKESSKL